MPSPLSLRSLVLLVLLFASGCTPYLNNGSARTLDRGVTEYNLQAGWTREQRSGLGGVPFSGTIRGGVTDRVELSGGIWDVGARVDGKFGLIRPVSERWGLNLALAPGIAVWVDGKNVPTDPDDESALAGLFPQGIGVWSFQLPLLVGVRLGGHEITLGPRVIEEVPNGLKGVGRVGASGAVSFRIGDKFRLIPEVSWVSDPLWGNPYAALESSHGRWSFVLGFAFDQRTRNAAPRLAP